MTEPFERWNGIAQVGAENKRKEREKEKQIKGKKREKVPLVQEEVKKWEEKHLFIVKDTKFDDGTIIWSIRPRKTLYLPDQDRLTISVCYSKTKPVKPNATPDRSIA